MPAAFRRSLALNAAANQERRDSCSDLPATGRSCRCGCPTDPFYRAAEPPDPQRYTARQSHPARGAGVAADGAAVAGACRGGACGGRATDRGAHKSRNPLRRAESGVVRKRLRCGGAQPLGPSRTRSIGCSTRPSARIAAGYGPNTRPRTLPSYATSRSLSCARRPPGGQQVSRPTASPLAGTPTTSAKSFRLRRCVAPDGARLALEER
jgi:hypothetical protein